ncbi:MAG: DJ-1/PfpI family protein [Treponema sp.]|nr:DJ-1/PfpI family protein [Treponema sp.]
MNKKALVLLADGFEDVEAITPIDYLCRAGIEVTTASISGSLTVTSRWGKIKLIADTTLADLGVQADNWDAVIIPGGLPGAENLAASRETGELLKNMAISGKFICAICASPVIVLAPLGLISGKKYTCYPGFEEKCSLGTHFPDRVVIDGSIITSKSAGTAGEWAISIIKALVDETESEKIAKTILI